MLTEWSMEELMGSRKYIYEVSVLCVGAACNALRENPAVREPISRGVL